AGALVVVADSLHLEVRHDADDRRPRGPAVAALDPVAERVLAWPDRLGEAAIDQRHRRSIRTIFAVEYAPAERPAFDDGEVVSGNNLEPRFRPIVVARIDLAFDLDVAEHAWIGEIPAAHGGGGDARQRAHASEQSFVEARAIGGRVVSRCLQ